MNAPLTRRQFLTTTTGMVAGAGAASLFLPPGLAAAQPARICLGTRDVMLRHVGKPDVWSAAAAIGAEGIEINVREDLSFSDLFHPQKKYSGATPDGIEQLKADAQASGRRITALCMSNHFDERPEAEIEWCAKTARAAQALGVKAVRIDVVPRKLPVGQFLDFSVVTLKKLMEATEPTGVAFGIENHGHVTNNPEFLQPLFERVGSNRLGLTLDTGNFYWFGHPLSKVYQLVETFACRVFHTHCKSIKYPEDRREKQRPVGWEYAKYFCPVYEGDVDYARVVRILQKSNYAGDLCIEDEALGKFPKPEQATVLAKEIQYLKDRL
jgi:sugar phosphate isomerase/epimerase